MNATFGSEASSAALATDTDAALGAALNKILRIILDEYGLRSNHILILSAELHRLGMHKLVEEHIRKDRPRREQPQDDL